MKILGVDPGGTTGLCMVDTDRLNKPLGIQGTKLYPQLGLWLHEADLVVMETVVLHGSITEGKADQLRAVGAVQYMNQDVGNPPIIWITPEERGVVTKKIKVVVNYDVPKPHARDAYLLVVAYALREGLVEIDDAKHFIIKG